MKNNSCINKHLKLKISCQCVRWDLKGCTLIASKSPDC